MAVIPIFGENLAKNTLEDLEDYAIATQSIPWDKWSEQITIKPKNVIYCRTMELSDIDSLAKENAGDYKVVVGLGGGVACDTAKFLAKKWEIPLILIPSIISVDAFLCEAVGIRNENRVRYIDAPRADKIIIDYNLIRTAPPHLNYAGVGDVISCASALGDWLIARDEFDDDFDQNIFQRTKNLLKKEMFPAAEEIHNLSNEGIKMLVEDFLLGEVILSEEWGNARPEEGSEHFLAYALEKLNPRPYPHGALVSLNVLIVLKLQGNRSVFSIDEVKEFLDTVGVQYSPEKMGIPKEKYRQALDYVVEYTKAEDLAHGLWYLDRPFSEASIDEIISWIYSF